MSPQAKPLLILDLDETLIHANDVPLDKLHDFTVGSYFVYKRPFVDEFLAAIIDDYCLAIWSSASTDYVTFIVDKLVPANIKLEFVWARTRCVHRVDWEHWGSIWLKDLRKVKRRGYNLQRILIVDDEPSKLARNYGNAIYINPFSGDSADAELPLLLTYLRRLRNQSDFRKVEKRGWRLKIAN